jgi:organic hydroperoxide reductase OsmC/OhrA
MTARNGSADSHGDVRTGSGTITARDSVFSGPYSYDSRFGDHQGTNPGQLIAAAQAGCFTMALASKLASAGRTCCARTRQFKDTLFQQLASAVPMGRLGDAAEVAKAVSCSRWSVDH